jgi:FYVE, RhoGEF and PH domain containing 3
LSNYLIQPIQRIPRYKMFLEQIVKLTPDDHPDSAALKKSLALVSEIAVTVDEVCEKVENMGKVIEISKAINVVGFLLFQFLLRLCELLF